MPSETLNLLNGGFISALAGALGGALAAFGFQWFVDNRQRREADHLAMVRIQMAIAARMNTIDNIENLIIGPHRLSQTRELVVPIAGAQKDVIPIDYGSIAFLMADGREDHANLAMKLLSAESAYDSTLLNLAQRSAYFDTLYASGCAKLLPNGHVSFNFLPFQHMKLKGLTDALYESCDAAKSLLAERSEEVFRISKALFPERKFPAIYNRDISEPSRESPTEVV